MIKAGDSGGYYGIWVFPYLPIKLRVVHCALRLLKKLRIRASVKKTGCNGNCLPVIAPRKGIPNNISFAFHVNKIAHNATSARGIIARAACFCYHAQNERPSNA